MPVVDRRVTPSGALNGVNTTFTVPTYVAGSLRVLYNGVLLLAADVSELSTTSFSLSFAPTAADFLAALIKEA